MPARRSLGAGGEQVFFDITPPRPSQPLLASPKGRKNSSPPLGENSKRGWERERFGASPFGGGKEGVLAFSFPLKLSEDGCVVIGLKTLPAQAGELSPIPSLKI